MLHDPSDLPLLDDLEERVLLIPPTRRDAEVVEAFLRDSGIACVICPSMASLRVEAARGVGAVLVAEEALATEPEELLAHLALQPVWSDLPVILLSRTGAESPKLSAMVTRAGNVTVLERPVRLSTFLSVVRSALRGRTRQYQVRDHLSAMASAGQALRRSHDAFFTLVDRAPFGVYVVDGDFRVHSVNGSAQVVFRNVRPLLGRDFGDVIRVVWSEPVATEILNRFRRVLDTGEPHFAPTHTEMRRDLGVVQSFEWELHRVALPDGQSGVVCYFYESTHLRAVESELREARRKIDAALLAGEVGIYHWNIPADRLTGDVNFLATFGVAVDEEGGAGIDDFMNVIDPEQRPRIFEQLQATLATDVPFEAEYRILNPSGERWVVSRGAVERDGRGEAVGWIGVIVNITERKRIEEQRRLLLESERAARGEAERASRMKDEFLATLSHEIRTPLTAILGWTHLLSRGMSSSEDVAKGLAVIDRNARAQSQIIADLLDMNRIANGKLGLDMQTMSLGPVVQAAVDTIGPVAEGKGVHLDVLLDPSLGAVHGDPFRLQQVFWNLLSNAVKFTDRDQRVEVRGERVGSSYEIRVSDSGEGISPDFLPYLFDRFRQADGSTTRRHGGLGLGLAIVKQIVELHGGAIRVESRGKGEGSAFTIALPAADEWPERPFAMERRAGEPDEGWRSAVRPDDMAGARVLVVDDEADCRDLVKRLLEDCNASVWVASSAAEGLALLRRVRPDVLISDIGMPGEDGYSLIRNVRALAPEQGGATPAIGLTAYARAEDRVKAIRAGFQHHVTKPVEPSELLALVASFTGPARDDGSRSH